MRRLIHVDTQILPVLLVITIALFLHAGSREIEAQNPTAPSSSGGGACSVNAIQSYLYSKGSPLADAVATFVSAGQQYNVDPRFVVGIANAESTLATRWSTCRPEDHNAWGYLFKDTDGTFKCQHFNSWEEGIDAVTKHIGENYFQRYGQTTIPSFVKQPAGTCTSHCWCASGCTHWVANVSDAYEELGGDRNTTDLSFARCTSNTTTPLPTSKRIGLQAGHGKGDPGSLSCDKTVKEADITAAVSEKVADLLKDYGFQVDMFIGPDPAISGYRADAFVSLHADHCPDPTNPSSPSGYKVTRYGGKAGSGLDGSGDPSDQLTQALWDEYRPVTSLPPDDKPGHFPDRMRYYYALKQIDASTPGSLIEMGWLSGDLDVLVNEQDKVATGIVNGILRFLGEPISTPQTSSATVLVIDVSGSMEWPDPSGKRKIDAARDAGQDIVNMIKPFGANVGGPGQQEKHQMSLISFSDLANLESPLTSGLTAIENALARLQPIQSTNMAHGLTLANEQLATADPTARHVLILLSDGVPTVDMSGAQNGDREALKQEILKGPVAEAQAQKYCIYTIGFGEPGAVDPGTGELSIDEDFLKAIAAASAPGCGGYFPTTDTFEITNVYAQARCESVGKCLEIFGGQLAQGETTPGHPIQVPDSQGKLFASLNWPGSSLELILKDPTGKQVDDKYPGSTVSVFNNLVYVIIDNPMPGTWQTSVFGKDVPEGVTPYNVTFSARAAPVIPTPIPEPTATEPPAVPAPPTPEPPKPEPVVEPGSGLTFVFFIVALLGVVGATAFFAMRNRLVAVVSSAGLRVIAGQASPSWAVFRRGQLRLGRGRENELVISDTDASRLHARIMQIPQGYLLEDLGSTNGTYVNGERVERQMLRPGDVIQIGHTQVRFEVPY